MRHHPLAADEHSHGISEMCIIQNDNRRRSFFESEQIQ
jgi:hypothetical protein